MRPRAYALLTVLCLAVIGSAPTRARAQEAAWLPDSVLMLRVGDRVVRVRDYVKSYFSIYPPDRPQTDSLGRVGFLGTLMNKEVLGILALKVNRPLGFEDRLEMRVHTQRVLSDALFQHAVMDSVRIDTAAVERAWALARQEHHVRHILFDDPALAAKVREDLVRKRITWKAAHARYSKAKKDSGPEGDLGWVSRRIGRRTPFEQFFPLEIGAISQPYVDGEGIHLVTMTERRPLQAPHPIVRREIESEFRQQEIDRFMSALTEEIRREAGVVYDSVNIAWAAPQFPEPVSTTAASSGGLELNVDETLPLLAPADTGRVLARLANGRHYSIGAFLDEYSHLHSLQRPAVNTVPLLIRGIDVLLLEPMRAAIAVRRGLDKDPLVRAKLDERLEALRVEHLYGDSIDSKVFVDKAARRRYYDAHLAQYHTYARARFAALPAHRKGEADSLAARLRAGDKAEAMLRADSLAGRRETGSIQEMSDNERGRPFYTTVFQRLRPGQVAVEGPDREGDFAVIQLIEYDPGRQLSFEEAEHYVDETVRNIESERRLEELINRHKRGLAIESHPELVMRIRLEEPT